MQDYVFIRLAQTQATYSLPEADGRRMKVFASLQGNAEFDPTVTNMGMYMGMFAVDFGKMPFEVTCHLEPQARSYCTRSQSFLGTFGCVP